MKGFVIDCSVAAKWLFLESGSNESLAILDQIDFFYAPDLFQIELHAVISKKVRKKELTTREALQKKYLASVFPCQTIEYNHISELAFDISISLPVTLYDACYLATAVLMNCIFYTADSRLARGLSNTPLSKYVRDIYESG